MEDNIEYHSILNKLQWLNKLEDKAKDFSTEGIINKTGSLFRKICELIRTGKWFKKIKRVIWNKSGEVSLIGKL